MGKMTLFSFCFLIPWLVVTLCSMFPLGSIMETTAPIFHGEEDQVEPKIPPLSQSQDHFHFIPRRSSSSVLSYSVIGLCLISGLLGIAFLLCYISSSSSLVKSLLTSLSLLLIGGATLISCTQLPPSPPPPSGSEGIPPSPPPVTSTVLHRISLSCAFIVWGISCLAPADSLFYIICNDIVIILFDFEMGFTLVGS